MYTYEQLKWGDKISKQVEQEQENFRSELNEITRGSNKSQTQLDTIKNAKNLYNSRQKIIDLLNDNSRIRFEAIYKAIKKITGTGLKILTPKQVLQRLPIALAQVKAGNSSESLLNEIRQIVKSIQWNYKIETIFMNSENSKPSEHAF